MTPTRTELPFTEMTRRRTRRRARLEETPQELFQSVCLRHVLDMPMETLNSNQIDKSGA